MRGKLSEYSKNIQIEYGNQKMKTEGRMMLYITICDDEEIIAQKIKQIIEKEAIHIDIPIVIKMCTNGGEFLDQYQVNEKELIFMDIDMPVKSGIEVIRQLEEMERNRNVVLITSHDHLALESLSCAPFQTIRKVMMESDIPLAIKRYLREWESRRPTLELKGSGTIYRLEREDVLYLEKYKHNVIVHRKKGEDIQIRSSMQDLEKELSGRGFVRVHAGYMVNLRHCHSLEKNEVVLREGLRIPVSRDRRKIVKEQFMVSRE